MLGTSNYIILWKTTDYYLCSDPVSEFQWSSGWDNTLKSEVMLARWATSLNGTVFSCFWWYVVCAVKDFSGAWEYRWILVSCWRNRCPWQWKTLFPATSSYDAGFLFENAWYEHTDPFFSRPEAILLWPTLHVSALEDNPEIATGVKSCSLFIIWGSPMVLCYSYSEVSTLALD